jgi:diphthamide biosynthesis protein 4
MAYTKDYYHILGLQAPGWNTSTSALLTADLRRAYKLALLAAHPDKNGAAQKQKETGTYTVDDVKEAYTALVGGEKKAEYDNWFLHNRHTLPQTAATPSLEAPSSDFVLGLELLDLSDFDVLDPEFAFTNPTSEEIVEMARRGEVTVGKEQREGERQMEWTRACRCGDDKGFRILEEELGDAEARGEKEVLVGCEGCSLWVRVGFEVEEG